MAFLQLYGYTVPVSKGGEVTRATIGQRTRSFNGTMQLDRRAIKRAWRFRTTPLQEAAVKTIRAIIEGRAQTWSFENNDRSNGGLAATSSANEVYEPRTAGDGDTVTDATPRTGSTHALRIDAAHTNVLSSDQATCEGAGTPPNGYAVLGASAVTGDSSNYWQGAQSVKIVTAGSGDGADTTPAASGASANFTASAYVKADPTAASWFLVIRDTDAGSNIAAKAFTPSETAWKRVEVTAALTSGTNYSVRLYTASTGVRTLYVDGVQLEQTDYATAWRDGAGSAGSMVLPASFLENAPGVTLSVWHWMNATNRGAAYFFTLGESTLVNSFVGTRQGSTNRVRVQAYDGDSTAFSAIGADPLYATDGDWHHTVVTYDVASRLFSHYEDGALDQAQTVTNGISLASLVLRIGATSTGTLRFDGGMIDDLLLLPTAIDATAVAALYNAGAGQPLDTPRVVASGDFAPESSVTCYGEVNRESYVGISNSGSWQNNRRVIDFTLHEV